MQIPYSEFARIVKAFGRMTSQPDATASENPGLDNVLLCNRVGHEGAWAIFSNGFEILALRVRGIARVEGRLLYSRADLVSSLKTMESGGAQPADVVEMGEGVLRLSRARVTKTRGHLEFQVASDLPPNVRSLPEPSGASSMIEGGFVAIIQREVDLWAAPGHRFWLTNGSGAWSAVRGIYRSAPAAVSLPEERLIFSDMSGFMALDPEQPCSCALAAIPGIREQELPWVSFAQPDAVYYSQRLSQGDEDAFNAPSREIRLQKALKDTVAWLQVPRRTDRRELVRVLTEHGGEGVIIASGPDGKVTMTNDLSENMPLPMVEAEGPGRMVLRPGDLCRVLRQDFGRFTLPADPKTPGIVFSRTQGEEPGVITLAVRG